MPRPSWMAKPIHSVLPNVLLVLALPVVGYLIHQHPALRLTRTDRLSDADPATRPATTAEAGQEDAVREAAVLYQISHDPAPAALYFVRAADGRQTRSDALAARLAGSTPPVESDSRGVMRGRRCVCDRVTGRPGAVIILSGVRWLAGGECELDETTFARIHVQTGCTYRLARQDGCWTVTGLRKVWP